MEERDYTLNYEILPKTARRLAVAATMRSFESARHIRILNTVSIFVYLTAGGIIGSVVVPRLKNNPSESTLLLCALLAIFIFRALYWRLSALYTKDIEARCGSDYALTLYIGRLGIDILSALRHTFMPWHAIYHVFTIQNYIGLSSCNLFYFIPFTAFKNEDELNSFMTYMFNSLSDETKQRSRQDTPVLAASTL
ncbi:MAG: hypothetical protein H7X92_04650 [Chitinophagales bacterium]|nr:hypothetical protein [Hyphomicrobiales bacterium]